jgi:hypothetical protein
MAKTLMCRLGRHDWKRKRNEEGQPYKECARCGKCREQQSAVGRSGDWTDFAGGNSVN